MERLNTLTSNIEQSNLKKIQALWPHCVTETKGTMDSMQLTPIEKRKIECCERLFNEMSTANVRYHQVASYQDLLNELTACK